MAVSISCGCSKMWQPPLEHARGGGCVLCMGLQQDVVAALGTCAGGACVLCMWQSLDRSGSAETRVARNGHFGRAGAASPEAGKSAVCPKMRVRVTWLCLPSKSNFAAAQGPASCASPKGHTSPHQKGTTVLMVAATMYLQQVDAQVHQNSPTES